MRCWMPSPRLGRNAGDTFKDAKLAVDRALHVAHSAEEWYLADQLRRGIKEVEAAPARCLESRRRGDDG